MRPTTRAVGRCPAALRAFIPGKVKRGSASVSMLCLALTRLAKIRRTKPLPADAGRFPFGVKLQILKYDIVSHIA